MAGLDLRVALEALVQVVHGGAEFAEAHLVRMGHDGHDHVGGKTICGAFQQRACESFQQGVHDGFFAAAHARADEGFAAVLQYGLHVREIQVHEARPQDEICDAAHALDQHTIGHLVGVGHLGAALANAHEFFVGDDDHRV